MSENELFCNLDVPDNNTEQYDKRESFGRLTEKIKENKKVE